MYAWYRAIDTDAREETKGRSTSEKKVMTLFVDGEVGRKNCLPGRLGHPWNLSRKSVQPELILREEKGGEEAERSGGKVRQ